ncbi:MAG TPA: histidine phosphatase family protein [Candidatus Paceibacterota bacterium]|nr:histidine phosphatase family protein [Candidatus Paceibacterota bacterium]
MDLKRLIILRHCDADDSGKFLTQAGNDRAVELGKLIKERFNSRPGKTIVISSEALRAIRTAYWIQIGTGSIFRTKTFPGLYSDERNCFVSHALAAIDGCRENMETLVVITHLEMAEQLPHSFGSVVLKMPTIPRQQFDRGHGIAIDCEKKTWELI